MDKIGYVDVVTFGLALLGSVLGVLNTWRNFNRDRIKLRVRFVYGYAMGAPSQMPKRGWGVEVTNLSTFPVTIQEVGLHIVGRQDRMAFITPVTIDGGILPRRLESREQVTAYVDARPEEPRIVYRDVYAKTACGEIVTCRKNLPNASVD